MYILYFAPDHRHQRIVRQKGFQLILIEIESILVIFPVSYAEGKAVILPQLFIPQRLDPSGDGDGINLPVSHLLGRVKDEGFAAVFKFSLHRRLDLKMLLCSLLDTAVEGDLDAGIGLDIFCPILGIG